MANSVQIRYRGEVLCCLDQTEVKTVEPYRYRKEPPQNLLNRICGMTYQFFTGKRKENPDSDFEDWTKISFKDGSWIRLKIPFLEFINGYC